MKKVNLLLFLMPVFALFALNLLLPKGEEVSKLEKRTLRAFPSFSLSSLWSGQYFKEFDNYFADHFVFRDRLVQAGSEIKDWRGLTGEDRVSIVVQKGGNNMFQDLAKSAPPDKAASVQQDAGAASKGTGTGAEAQSAAPATSPGTGAGAGAATTSATAAEAAKDVQNTDSERYLVLKDRAMALFSYVPEYGQAYAEALRNFQKAIDPKIRVYNLLAPTAIEFVKEAKYKTLSDSQKDAIGQIYKALGPNITPIDAHSALRKHTDEYIYFRTDHHWTALGAYYAYTAFMDRIGEKPVPLSQYEREEWDGYLGSAYSATLDVNLKKNPDTVSFYKPFVPHDYALHWVDEVGLKRNVVDRSYAEEGGGGYAVFLEGDSPWGAIETDNKNGKKLLVIKDSYANPFVPFLLPHFQTVYFIDPRHFTSHIFDFVKEKGVTDVLFLNNLAVTAYNGYTELLLSKE